jgi:hypothetical protein
MFRRIVASIAVVFFAVIGLIAAEVKGKLVKIDDTAKTITIKVEEDEKTFTYNSDTKFVSAKGKELNEEAKKKLFEAKASKKGGREVTVITEKKGEKDIVTEVKVAAGKKKDAK